MVIERNPSIDVIKGILIILVVIGHILRGSLDDNTLRYVIYSFHMPAFFFVSGYLLNLRKIKDLSFREIMHRYWNRMLRVWCIAWIIYSIYVFKDNFSVYDLLSNIVNPYYHLWFVPSLFLMTIIVWVIIKKCKNEGLSYALLLGLAILTSDIGGDFSEIPRILRCHFLFFFILGIWSREKLTNTKQGGVIIISYLIFVAFVKRILEYSLFCSYFQFPCVMLLSLWGILPILQGYKLKNPVLEYCGKYSLEIYLWHVIPILVLK